MSRDIKPGDIVKFKAHGARPTLYVVEAVEPNGAEHLRCWLRHEDEGVVKSECAAPCALVLVETGE